MAHCMVKPALMYKHHQHQLTIQAKVKANAKQVYFYTHSLVVFQMQNMACHLMIVHLFNFPDPCQYVMVCTNIY